MAKRRLTASFDWILISIFFSIQLIGLLLLYASSYEGPGFWFDLQSIFGRQLIWFFGATVAFVVFSSLDWRLWNSSAFPVYFLCLISLVVVLVFGKEINGAKSWFHIFGYSLQPSEFAKYGTSLGLAALLSQNNINLENIKTIFLSFVIFLVPAALIFLQPDPGTAIVYFAMLVPLFRAGLNASLYILGFLLAFIFIGSLIWSPLIMVLLIFNLIYFFMVLSVKERRLPLSILFLLFLFSLSSYTYLSYSLILLVILMAGSYFSYLLFKAGKYKELILAGVVAVSSIALSFGTEWAFDNLLKSHHQERINAWLKPSTGELYNIIQSKTAIGSGGVAGKGFLNGTMTKLNYVPEQSTDFVFSILGEEQGFLGSMSLIVLFMALIWRILTIAERTSFPFIKYYAYAISGIIFFHFFINIGMTMGIMPVIGIPLPLVSKGGSSLLAFAIMMGVLVKMDTARTR